MSGIERAAKSLVDLANAHGVKVNDLPTDVVQTNLIQHGLQVYDARKVQEAALQIRDRVQDSTQGLRSELAKPEPVTASRSGAVSQLAARAPSLEARLDDFFRLDARQTERDPGARLRALGSVFGAQTEKLRRMPQFAEEPALDRPDMRNIKPEMPYSGDSWSLKFPGPAAYAGQALIRANSDNTFAVDVYRDGHLVGGQHDFDMSDLAAFLKQTFFAHND